MEVKDGDLLFELDEAIHILWSHSHITVAENDNDKKLFIDELAAAYSIAHRDNLKQVSVKNEPTSRQFLAQRILKISVDN